jgi:hypothetical protein
VVWLRLEAASIQVGATVFNKGDIIEWNGMRGTVASKEDVIGYWGEHTYARVNNKVQVWVFWPDRTGPTNLSIDVVRLIKSIKPRRTLPDWF